MNLDTPLYPEQHTLNFSNTFQNKRVFLSGHTGFKGSWMLTWLHQLGAEVKGYALSPENSFDLYNAIHGDQLCSSVIADIRDKDRLIKEVKDFQPDFIFHFAAQPLVRLSYQTPIETYQTNVIGTGNIIMALRELTKPSLALLVTTDKVYENKEWHYPYRETDRLGGFDPYSSSKAAAEILIQSFRNSFFPVNNYNDHGKAIVAVRAGNVIGGGDWAKDRIVPDIVRALQDKKPVDVRNPFAVRPWQHVLEPLGGYLLLAEKLAKDPIKYSGEWNFGPFAEDNKTVENLVQIAIRTWGSGSYATPKLKGQPHEAGLLKLDINKAMNILGWKPKMYSQQAIQMTMEWYKDFLDDHSQAKQLIEKDIATYTAI